MITLTPGIKWFLMSLVSSLVVLSPLPGTTQEIDDAQHLVQLAPNLNVEVAELALKSIRCAHIKLGQRSPEILGIIDYSRPSTAKRFWLFDLRQSRLLLEDLIAHGRNSGENSAKRFSNSMGSLQSSLGLFRVGEKYQGKHGESLQLIGLEQGFNDQALARAIVLHSAPYVSKEFIYLHQRLGRSFGCPVVNPAVIEKVTSAFEDGEGLLFIFYPDKKWLSGSPLLTQCGKN